MNFGESWTREQEVISDSPRVTSDVNDVCYVNDEKEPKTLEGNEPTWEQYADRIVSCVNALAGIDDPADMADTINGRQQDRWPESNVTNEHSRYENNRPTPSEFRGSIFSKWGLESRLGRVAHGVPHRVDRLKAIGNAQIPLVAATAWRILAGE